MSDRFNKFRMLACCVMWLQAGCGEDTAGCVAGASTACTCANSAQGAQLCRDDGTYAECVCESRSKDEKHTSGADAGTTGKPGSNTADTADAGNTTEAAETTDDRSRPDAQTSDRDDTPAPEVSSASGETTGGAPDEQESDPMADCETFPVNFTQSTTIAPGCYRVIAPPSFAELADLTISRGVTLYFNEATWLEIPKDSKLTAHGSEESPIIFQGAIEEPGYWGGIRVIGSASMNYVTIQHAGGLIATDPEQRPAGLSVDGALELKNSRVAHNAGYGVRNQNHESMAIFENNVLTANRRPLLVNVRLVSYVGDANDFSGNEVDGIDVNTEVSSDVLFAPYAGRVGLRLGTRTWVDVGAPYRMLEGLIVHTYDSLTLSAGVNLLFPPGTGLIVDGSLLATGTEQAPVRLEAEDPNEGWFGVVSCSGTLSLAHTTLVDVAADEAFVNYACSDGVQVVP